MPDLEGDIVDLLPAGGGSDRAWGQVTQASPLKVQFAGDTGSVPVTLGLASYAPTLHDFVALERVGGAWVAIGKLTAR